MVSRHLEVPMHLIWSICLWLGEACGWSFLIWSHSLYVLGGSFWYKRAFLKTLGTLIVISILGSIITVQIVEWIGEEGMMGLHDWLEEKLPVDDAEQTACIWRRFL